MRVDSLKLTEFRNYSRLEITPDAGFCVLTGRNGAGKTNVLEAIFLCSFGRSQRTPRDAELISYDSPEGSVILDATTRQGKRNVRMSLYAKKRKRVILDGVPLTRSGELMGCLNVVMFSPEDLSLVKDGPAERRRFLNMELSGQSPAYYYKLQQYNNALKQRNTLLKDGDNLDYDMLESWDEQLAGLGAAITLARTQFVGEIADAACRRHRQMSDGMDELVVSYQPNLPPTAPDELAGVMMDRLSSNLERDIFRGTTSVGPHRDDILLTLNGVDARIYGSQGQQRTVALALKLSVIELIRRLRGENPVLLLDDVFSELDAVRQARLIASIEGCQAFITCTHLEELTRAGADSMQIFNVSNGTIVEV